MIKPISFFLFLISLSISSQGFETVDQLVFKYPKFSNIEKLASKIEKDFSTNEEKIRAAFFWLATNIRYDLKEYYNPTQRTYRFKYANEAEKLQKIQNKKDAIINIAFRTKRGVCEEYAQSFTKLCTLLNIESVVISGYVRNRADEIGNSENKPNHVWNAVKLNDKWLLLDATWAAGYEEDGKWIKTFNNYFYDIPNEKIFKTHFPEKSIWVLRFGSVSKEGFYRQPIYEQAFLTSKAELLAPLDGVIPIEKNKPIELNFRNLDTTSVVFYQFKNDAYPKKAIIKTKGKFSTLRIPNPEKNSELYLFSKRKRILLFKTQ